MRAQFTVLVVSDDPELTLPFQQLGAIARFVPAPYLSDLLRLGHASTLIAEAIVIDGSISLNDDRLLGAILHAQSLRALPDHVAMPNGIRWKHLPITIVVDSDELVDRSGGDPAMNGLAICSAARGWQHIHSVVAVGVRSFGLRLVDELRSVGWQIEDRHGRLVRTRAPVFKRRNERPPVLETELYSAPHDRWFSRRSRRERFPLSVIHTEPEAIAHDLNTFRDIIEQPLIEPKYQRFLDERSYVFGSAPFEMQAQPKLWDPDANEYRYPDYIQRRWSFDDDEPARLIELKAANVDVLVGARKTQKLGTEFTTGITQQLYYKELLADPRAQIYRDALIAPTTTVGRSILLAGRGRGLDARAFERQRALYDHVTDIWTYDGLIEEVERRYFTDHAPPDNPYGGQRIGLPTMDIYARADGPQFWSASLERRPARRTLRKSL